VEETLKELEDAKDEPTLKFVKRCPVTFLREVKEDGTDVLIGTLDVARCHHGELMGPDGVDWENKEKRQAENDSLEAGDPRIIWCFGGELLATRCQDISHITLSDYLASSHHRRGIMTDAVDTMFHDWAIPRMNVRHMLVSVFEGNEGSAKVFLRNGFTLKGRYKEHFEVKGKVRGLDLLEWQASV